MLYVSICTVCVCMVFVSVVRARLIHPSPHVRELAALVSKPVVRSVQTAHRVLDSGDDARARNVVLTRTLLHLLPALLVSLVAAELPVHGTGKTLLVDPLALPTRYMSIVKGYHLVRLIIV